MSSTLQKLDQIHQTKKGKAWFGAAELLLAYIFASLAIDSGQLWQYILALFLTIGGLNNLLRAVFGKNNPHGKIRSKKR